jgi:hypothetical protein
MKRFFKWRAVIGGAATSTPRSVEILPRALYLPAVVTQ